jgi:aminoglycoside phosphotransferase family enzyme/predicted kinase
MTDRPDPLALPAEVAETHLSVVFFVGDRAYKLKKPVDVGFVDLTTREERLRVCLRELELNRRLTPDVYLEVVDIMGEGGPIDHLLVMRRLPVERRLSTLIADGDPVVAGQLRLVARQLADFHSRVERSEEISRAGEPEQLVALWRDNQAGIEPFADRFLDRSSHELVGSLAERYLAGRHDLLRARVEGGHVVDGHGDLQAADIFCLDDGPRILDCIEFNDRFRHGDVIADVAFLAMDLERLGAPDLARLFLDAYAEYSGETCPRSLVEHYVAYRAHVRCKVSCLRADQVEGTEREESVAEARRLLRTTLRWLDASRQRLVLVGGPPGAGKSTLAGAVGRAMGWPVLSSDEVRDELVARAGPEAVGEGRYSAEARRAVYVELVERARVALAMGESVVLDATWGETEVRDLARAAGDAQVADVIELRCTAPVEVATARVEARLASGRDASEATAEVAGRLASSFEPWPEAATVDTSGEPEVALEVALQAVIGTDE